MQNLLVFGAQHGRKASDGGVARIENMMTQILLSFALMLTCAVRSQHTQSVPSDAELRQMARLHARFTLPGDRPASVAAKPGTIGIQSNDDKVCPICGPIDTRKCKKVRLVKMSYFSWNPKPVKGGQRVGLSMLSQYACVFSASRSYVYDQ